MGRSPPPARRLRRAGGSARPAGSLARRECAPSDLASHFGLSRHQLDQRARGGIGMQEGDAHVTEAGGILSIAVTTAVRCGRKRAASPADSTMTRRVRVTKIAASFRALRARAWFDLQLIPAGDHPIGSCLSWDRRQALWQNLLRSAIGTSPFPSTTTITTHGHSQLQTPPRRVRRRLRRYGRARGSRAPASPPPASAATPAGRARD